MSNYYPSGRPITSIMVLLLVLTFNYSAWSNNPCTAYNYDFGQGWGEVVPCGNGANTTSNIDVDDAGPTSYALWGDCGDVLEAPNDYVAWFTFVILGGGGAFEWQLIETGNDDVLYELYYSNDFEGPNECEDLTFYKCGDDFNSWELLGVPNPNVPTRYYVALYTENPDNNVTVNLKFRKACGESCLNTDISVTASEDVCINEGQSTILSAIPMGGGGMEYEYLWSPNDGSINDFTSPNPLVSPSETTTYTVAVTGVDGCPAYDEVVVTVGGCCDTAPEIICPENYEGCVGDDVSPDILGEATYNSASGCGLAEITFEDDTISNFGCEGSVFIERHWFAMAANDPALTSECIQTITLNDVTPPEILFDDPRLQSLANGDTIRVECDTIMPFNMNNAIVIDDCDSEPTLEFDDYVSFEGDCLIDRLNWVMYCVWRATDDCGNVSEFEITVIIQDTTPPAFIGVDEELTVDCENIPDPDIPQVFDACDTDVAIELTETTEGEDCNYQIIRTWTATDACHNVSTITQNITVTDTVAPTITFNNPTLENAAFGDTLYVECDTIMPFGMNNAIVTDNCDSTPTLEFEDYVSFEGDCLIDRLNWVMYCAWIATDDCGNATEFAITVIIQDTTPPAFTDTPDDITVQCGQIPDPDEPAIFDACDDGVVVELTEDVVNGLCDNEYQIIRTWTATDACHNVSTISQTISVEDTTAPQLQGVPNDISVNCSDVPAPATITASDNCDNNVEVQFFENVQTNACGETITRTWTATDDCGNVSSQSQIINATDNEAPNLQGVPANTTVSCDNIPVPANPTAIDDCSEVTIDFNESILTGDCEGEATISRKWTATDACGNTTFDIQVIEVVDNSAPTLWGVPNDVDVDCGQVPAPTTVTASDNCDSSPEVEFFENVQTNACGETITRTWTAIDDCGNVSSQSQIINATDNEAPTLQGVPNNIDVACGQVPNPATVTASDNCDNNVEVQFSENVQTNACGETITRTWTATDDCGNVASQSQIINATDNTPPTLNGVPNDVSVSCGQVPNPATVTASDNCDNNVEVQFSENVQTNACGETITRTWTATDDCGNVASQSQIINATDNEAPTLQGVPANTTVSCDNIPVPANPTAIDDCSEVTIDFNESILTGNCEGEATISRKWTATDACGNTTFDIQVIEVVDNSAPTLWGVPNDVDVDCGQVPNPATVTASDNCDNNVEVQFSENVQTNVCGETITRTWTATDDCGNISSQSQIINTTDNTAPTLNGVPNDVDVACGQVPNPATVTAYDNCDNNVEVQFSENVQTNACGETITRTWTATDDCGNVSSQSQVISATDNTAPTLNGVPNDIEVACGQVPNPATVTTSDNCDNNVDVQFSENVQTNACGETITRTWTATDDCGNISSQSQIINATDNTAPTLNGVPNDIHVACGQVPNPATVTASDNCDNNVEVQFSENVQTNACGETITRTWTATDDCGNVSSQSQIINATDNESPTLQGVPANTTVSCDNIPVPANPIAIDDCSEVTIDFNESILTGDCEGEATISRKWTATDACGNTTFDIQVIEVVDNSAPTLWGVPNDVDVDCGQVPIPTTVTASDNCDSSPEVEFFENVQTNACGETINRTWTATDDCGNISSQSQIINATDNTAPTLNGVPNDIDVACGQVPNPATVTTSDNCDNNVDVQFSENVQTNACGETITRTWTATDDCGNISSQSQIINATDNTAPTLNGVPNDIDVACGQVPNPATVTASDNCDNNVEVQFSENVQTNACGETITRTWTATDDCGNVSSQSQVINATDNTPPTLNGVPNDIHVACGQVPNPATVTASDNCDNNVEVQFSENVQTNACGETITRTWTATDDCGNVSSQSQVISATDNTAPTLNGVPNDIEVACGQVPNPATVTASDNCDNNVDVQFSENVQTNACGETITRTWTATDDCGNISSQSQIINATDNTAPTLNGVPNDIDVACGQVPNPATVTASDNCDNNVEVQFSENVQTNACGETITRTWTATDDCGNTTSQSQIINATDNEAPTLQGVPANTTVSCDNIPVPANPIAVDDCSEVTIDFNESILTGDCEGEATISRKWTATDACGNTTFDIQVIEVVDNSAPTLWGVPNDVDVDCGQIPAPTTVTASDNCDSSPEVEFFENVQTNACGETITRTWTATDDCGNVSSQSQIINATDDTAPTLHGVPNDVSVSCGQVPNPATVTASDNCDNNVEVQFSENVQTNACGETITRTWTATDDCGNVSSQSQIINATDNEAPTLQGVPANTTVSCDNIPVPANPIAVDDCSEVTIDFNESVLPGDCAGESTITRKWTATDACGNTTFDIQVLWVVDNEAPVLLNVPDDAEISCEDFGQILDVVATDNCSSNVDVQYNETVTPMGCGDLITRSWTAIDECNNATTEIQQIRREDTTAPEIHNCPENITVEGCGNQVTWTPPTATDNCSEVTLTSSHSSNSTFESGTTTVIYTATDVCGNTTTCSFTVTIDGVGEVTCPDDIWMDCTSVEHGEVITWTPPNAAACCSDCPAETAIADYVFMGEMGGHRYYCSEFKETWENAQQIAQSMGGYLAVINDAYENEQLANFLVNQKAHIGLTDQNHEGTFSWVNGDALTYTNWYPGQPNNKNDNQDFVELLPNGQWNDIYPTDSLEFIVEIPCVDVDLISGLPNGSVFPIGTTTVTYQINDACGNTSICSFDVNIEPALTLECPDDIVVECQPGENGAHLCWSPPVASSCCSNCDPDTEIEGFVYMGEYGGHRYYCSREKATWQTASAISQSKGGYLAAIGSEEENQFVASLLTTQRAFIGLNDLQQEGVFRWSNGEVRAYSNWHAGEPDNHNGVQDVVQILPDGQWNDTYNSDVLEYVMEVPCINPVQTGGLPNGTFFPIGTTTITYVAEDNCGNWETCSFDVIVNCQQDEPDYCEASGTNTNYFWINKVRFNDLYNQSGNNNGYGDFTDLSTTVNTGSSYTLQLYPGFNNNAYYVYWKVWIDYNADGDFDDSGETIFYYRHYRPLQKTIKIPTWAANGPTRMRVAMKYGSYATPCETFSYGEVEDYTIIINNNLTGDDEVSERNNENTDEVTVIENTGTNSPSLSTLPLTNSSADAEDHLHIFPNPATDAVNIQVTTTNDAPYQVYIYNSTGQLVHQHYQQTYYEKTIQVDVTDFAKGVYFVKIATEGSSLSKSFTVQ